MNDPASLWDGFPPLADIRDARAGTSGARLRHAREAPPDVPGAACARCGCEAATLEWFWFESPDWTWQALCGSAG